MDKETAIERFYKENHINPQRVGDELDASYDPRLAMLPQKVDQWLENVDVADRPVLLELLSRYCYLSKVQCQLRYGRVLSALQEQLNKLQISIEEALFVTIEAGGAYASGGDNVRADLRYRNLGVIEKRQIVAAQSKLLKEELNSYRSVLFLDDVLGSGITMWNAIQQLHTRFPEWFDKQKIFCSSIAPRQRGIRHINKNCKKYGISLSWIYEAEWIQKPAFERNSRDYHQLEKYERCIGEFLTEPGKSFFMGFAKNRLLLSFYYNTPNNTLSTFWRKGVGVEPPFCRDGDQPSRPSLEALKKRKCHMGEQAYIFGVDRRRQETGG